jgi:hypothetical protein
VSTVDSIIAVFMSEEVSNLCDSLIRILFQNELLPSLVKVSLSQLSLMLVLNSFTVIHDARWRLVNEPPSSFLVVSVSTSKCSSFSDVHVVYCYWVPKSQTA